MGVYEGVEDDLSLVMAFFTPLLAIGSPLPSQYIKKTAEVPIDRVVHTKGAWTSPFTSTVLRQ